MNLIFVFLWTSTSATTLLFYFRVRAVYSDKPIIVKMFLFLWFLVTLSALPNLLYSDIRREYKPGHPAASSELIEFCYNVEKPHICGVKNPLTLPSNILNFIYETLIFVGVSLKIYSNSLYPPVGGLKCASNWRLKKIFTGEGLHAVSKSLLRSGQLYYG